MINEEGGIDPEQFRMEAMFDRMDAIGKAMLGLTIQCAQCHTHKYDPLTQAEYYRLFAFLNNCHEAKITVVHARRDRAVAARPAAVIRHIEDGLRAANPDWRERMAAWEESVRNDQPEWTVLPARDRRRERRRSIYVLDDGSILAAGYARRSTRPSSRPSSNYRRSRPSASSCSTIRTCRSAGRADRSTEPVRTDGVPGRRGPARSARTESRTVKFAKATADVNPPERELETIFDDKSGKRRVTGPIEYAIDGKNETAWSIDIGPGRSNVPRKAVFMLEKPIEAPAACGSRSSWCRTTAAGTATTTRTTTWAASASP